MQTIIVPLDGSALAEAALGPACSLARATGATLVLVQGVSFLVESRDREADDRAGATEALRYLEETARSLRGAGYTVQTEVFPCPALRAILFAAHKHHADLIAMNTHGRSGLEYALLGSVARQVLGYSPCPVLLTRAAEPVAPGGQGLDGPIVVPLDGSPLAEAALAYLASEHLERRWGIQLLRVVEPPSLAAMPPLAPSVAEELLRQADEQIKEQRRLAEAYLTSIGQIYAQQAGWSTVVRVGYAAEEILAQAREAHAGMIVMATAGRRGFDRLLHGSVARRVLHHATTPVLLVHDVSKH